MDADGMLLERNESFLLIVDVQEKLTPAVLEREQVVANVIRLVKSAQRLDVPVLMTEHCGSKIGPVLPDLRALVPEDAILPKVHFAAAREEVCRTQFSRLRRPQCVIAGMETHVCVLQSALSMKEIGYRPHVVRDAVSSRRTHDRETALERLRDAGVVLVSTEMVIFEWLKRGDDKAFRDLLPMIKAEPVTPA